MLVSLFSEISETVVSEKGHVLRACCPNVHHNNLVLKVTDLVVYGAHDERRGLTSSDLELSSQSG